MCLSKIDLAYDKPSDLIVDGWKQFRGIPAQLEFTNQTLGGKVIVPQDQWLKAEGLKDIPASDGKPYRPGFHVYVDENGLGPKSRRVYLRKITCAGEQDGKKCVIAQEMYVPSDPNGWPPKPTPAPKKLIDRIRKKRGGV